MSSGNSKSADEIFSICMQNSIVIEMGRVVSCRVVSLYSVYLERLC